MEIPHKTKNRIIISSNNPTSGRLCGENHYSQMFIAALFAIAKAWKQPKCPSTEEWIKKWYIYAMECYSAIKKTTNNKCWRGCGERGHYYTVGGIVN